jgi:hypothetical protein
MLIPVGAELLIRADERYLDLHFVQGVTRNNRYADHCRFEPTSSNGEGWRSVRINHDINKHSERI